MKLMKMGRKGSSDLISDISFRTDTSPTPLADYGGNLIRSKSVFQD
jgi:hypothetical protein